ncbi:MAG: ribosome maturation factor RimP [Rhodospirillaceae bacterium]|nr:ribosome maturation factor RimP [Rhodospirillaceae bacterium]
MERLKALEERIAPTLDGMGFEVVRVALTGGSRRTLQVMADRADGAPISVDDCAAISETLSAIFDVEEPIAGAYDLEVSSPGIDRPLTRPKDFAAFAGFEAKLETAAPVNGRRRFRGVLKGLSDGGAAVAIDVDGTEVTLPLAGLAQAKLVLTDKLIAATASGAPQAM